MKRCWIVLLTACLLVCIPLPAAALSLPGGEGWDEVLAQFEESFDENTSVAQERDGVFTLTARDGAVLTVRIERGTLPEGARLMAIAVPQNSEAYRWFSSVIDKGRLRAYALYFVKDGERVSFEGELTLSVTAPGEIEKPCIYRVSPDGMARKLPFETRNGRLLLTMGYEAPYFVIADEAGPSGVPKTGDAGFTGRLLAAGMAAMTLIILSKRHTIRKKKEGTQWS